MNICDKPNPSVVVEETQSKKTGYLSKEEIQQQQTRTQIAVLSIYSSSGIQTVLTKKFGFCLYEWMPDLVINTAKNVQDIMNTSLCTATQFLPKNAQFFSMAVVAGPIAEEILCRGVIQELLLKRAPVTLLQKISPQAANCLESNLYAKVGRVALSTLIFALAHLDDVNCAMSNRPIGVIGLGAVLGAIVEINGPKKGLIWSIFVHSMNNLFAYGLRQFIFSQAHS